MALFGQCGESDYLKVSFEDLFDLRCARIFKGEIVSIDSVSNCAEIIIEEQCPDILGVDLSAVPFFYHCEDSRGTVEDLARGHQAFEAEDEVLVLLVPENKDTGTRLYIIGHVDIRTTKKCGVSEYVLIKMSNQFVTIYDLYSGAKLSLEEFENIDEESPSAPLTLPCVATQELYDWWNYNFEVNGNFCSFDISQNDSNASAAYPSGWPMVTTALDVGTYPNNYCYYTEVRTEPVSPGRIFTENFSNSGGNPVVSYEYIADHKRSMYVTITDNTFLAQFDVDFIAEGTMRTTFGEATEEGGPRTISEYYGHEIHVAMESYAMGNYSETLEWTLNFNPAVPENSPVFSSTLGYMPYFAPISLFALDSSGEFVVEVGANAVYSLYLFLFGYATYSADRATLSFVGDGPCSPGLYYYWPYNEPVLRHRMNIIPISLVTLATEMEGVVSDGPSPFRNMLEAVNQEKSIGLRNVIMELFAYGDEITPQTKLLFSMSLTDPRSKKKPL